METQTKQCSCCGRILPITEFYKNTQKKDGLQNHCRECSHKAASVSAKNRKSIKAFSDDELIAEMRRRGFTGTINAKILREQEETIEL